MLSRRALVRSTQRLARAPVARTAFRKRPYSSEPSVFTGAADNEFNRERLAVKQHATESSDLWRKLSIYAVVPALIISGANAYKLWNEHWEHKAHEPPRSEQPEYSYQNIRAKNFWFGDGDKTLFWNDKVNYHKKDDE